MYQLIYKWTSKLDWIFSIVVEKYCRQRHVHCLL